jgi:hypothetical protein
MAGRINALSMLLNSPRRRVLEGPNAVCALSHVSGNRRICAARVGCQPILGQLRIAIDPVTWNVSLP